MLGHPGAITHFVHGGSRNSMDFGAESQEWSRPRKVCLHILDNYVLEMVVGTLSIGSFILAFLEADMMGDGVGTPSWLNILNVTILAIFIAETAAKVYVMRRRFFMSLLNVGDLCIVVLDGTALALQAIFENDTLPPVVFLRIFRLLRLARGFRVIVSFPQMALMVKCFASAIVTTTYGVIMTFIILTTWSVCAVHMIHPINQRVALTGAYDSCSRCPDAFSSVINSMLTFVQHIIAGDSWGQVTIPIIEEVPATAIFFLLVFVSVHFLSLNVIMSVIVDCALKASQSDIDAIVKQKACEYKYAEKKLKAICKEVDTNGSGDLTEEELFRGFDSLTEFQELLKAMDIERADMHMVFSILDADASGAVSHDEFVTELFKMKSHDSHTLIMFIKHHVTQIREYQRVENLVCKELQNQMNGLREEVHRIIAPDGMCYTVSAMNSVQTEGSNAPLLPTDRGEERDLRSQMCLQAKSFKDLSEELRSLRRVITEDLLHGMSEVSQKSESHRLLFSSVKEDILMAPCGGLNNARPEVPSPSKGRPPHGVAVATHRGPGLTLVGSCHGNESSAPSQRQQQPPRLASAWSTRGCCTAQRAEPERFAISASLKG